VNALRLDGKGSRDSVTLMAGRTFEAAFDVVDPDGDPLRYRWEVKPESDATQAGGDFEAAIPSLDGLLGNAAAATTSITVHEPGRYRLFAYAFDGQGHAAHANIPFRVEAQSLLAGEVMAVAYSGFREGQHPDRGEGAANPTRAQVLEDLQILARHGFRLIRMYDSGENTEATLELIREHRLPIRVLLGIWLKAEVSNHEGCAWLTEPIPPATLADNALANAAEIDRGIALARRFADVVVAVNVGNEALVEWNDHMVPVERVIEYVRRVRAEIDQPVTVADNYDWWARHGTPLAAEVDFIGVHTYPQWEGKTIEEALPYTIENIAAVRTALPGKPIVILEAGWATTSSEFGTRANEADQARHFGELRDWARANHTTVFWFEAFDEPWKGNAADPLGAEKHWGLFKVDRSPKRAMQ
jgi:exo-beta-1,3-glucanase (GH17 family)